MSSSKRNRRRSVVAGLTLALGSSLALMPAPAAHAATPFIVVGTSDVSDSNLVAAVIEPGFEKAYPQYDLQYVPKGTGAAITYAEQGSAAALVVHAASLENQFVQQGYSLEPAGRAIFWGDYVLLGPASDPAGVLTGAPHDVVTAFEKIAAAGAAGQANFVSRGGTPGTATQERALWALTGSQVAKCTVGSKYGGGARPTAGGTSCTNPDDTSPQTGAPYPSWYHTGDSASQANNISIANTCNFSGGNCYVFTDRGTFNYQQKIGNDKNLQIVTRDNSTSARGGLNDLINVFHAYGVNPAKFSGTNATDATAATDFLNFVTSPDEQEAIGKYIQNQKPFIPAATPDLSYKFKGGLASSGKKVRFKGTLANPIPGYPALGGVQVNLLQTKTANPLSIPKIVGHTTTNSRGNYRFYTKLKPGKFYQVGVGPITKLELPDLSPPFTDTFQPTSSVLGTAARVKLSSLATNGRTVTMSGIVSPNAKGSKARLQLYAAHPGKKLKKVKGFALANGARKFSVNDTLGAGKWKLELVYVNTKTSQIPTGSGIRTVTLH